jgi:hypothetical protein
MRTLAQTEPATWPIFKEFVSTVARDFWWVAPVVIGLWYLQWYRVVTNETGGNAFTALKALLIDLQLGVREAIPILAGVAGIGWFIIQGAAGIPEAVFSLDPVGTMIGGMVAAAASHPLGLAYGATPDTVVSVGLALGGGIFLIRFIGYMGEQVDGDGENGGNIYAGFDNAATAVAAAVLLIATLLIVFGVAESPLAS